MDKLPGMVGLGGDVRGIEACSRFWCFYSAVPELLLPLIFFSWS
jgi:hypothetical protein